VLGYQPGEWIGRPLLDFVRADDAQAGRKLLALARAEPGTTASERLRFRHRDDSQRVLETTAANYLADPAVAALVLTFHDVTEQERAEAALRESEAQYRSLVEDQTELIVRWRPDGTRTFANDAYARFFGLDRDGCVGANVFVLIPEPQREPVRRRVAALTPDRPTDLFERQAVSPDGTARWIEWSHRAYFDARGTLVGIQSVGRDITERKRAEARLSEVLGQLQALTAHLQSAREEERARIAREIHDELGAALTTLKFDVAWLKGRLTKLSDAGASAALVERADGMSASLDETIRTVRRIAAELRPSVLDDFGLAAALEWQAEEFQKRTGIRCPLEFEGEDLDLDAGRSTALFRIFQECLTNVARHAGATEVRARVRRDPGQVVMEVTDNGRGIAPGTIGRAGSFGILGMRERAALVGGSLEITGEPGRGTRLTARIPVGPREGPSLADGRL
jgi:PAS domain S-box-containing protein